MQANKRAIRTRTALVGSLLFLIAGITGSSLLIVRSHMRAQVAQELAADLAQAVKTSHNMQAERVAALQRENALLADLPSLKALMTTKDQRTIADGAVEFWKVSDNDLFALVSRDGHVLTAYTRGHAADNSVSRDLPAALAEQGQHLLLSGGCLFEFAVHPLYFGNQETGTLLGYVASGYSMDQAFVRQVSDPTSVFTSILSGQTVIATSLDRNRQQRLGELALNRTSTAVPIVLDGERYLGTVRQIGSGSAASLRLVVLKSSDEAERAVQQINHLVFFVGLCAVIAGSALMLAVAQVVTTPLEALASGVRAFGAGDSGFELPARGPAEVQELSQVFARMREERASTQRALLESERLATIGRMASSVSHDLRHYLAAIYANAEFLAAAELSNAEREELLIDIRAAVHGTTDLIDSLLLFSKTGKTAQRALLPLEDIVDRALALTRSHPDATGVTFTQTRSGSLASTAQIDSRQLERALYNLLLNACQVERDAGVSAEVHVSVESTSEVVMVSVADNGKGVPEAIRGSLFEPFVSEGKHKGTGLGLTLVHSIAREHGGEVALLASEAGHTVFRLSLRRERGIASAQELAQHMVNG